MSEPTVVDRDLRVRAAESYASDLNVHGWVEIGPGALLECHGDLVCLGITIEAGGSLRCRHLVSNYAEVDGSGGETRVMVQSVRARVVHTVQRALEEQIASGAVTAEHLHHFGGDLNPSWDYRRGDLVLDAEHFEAPEEGGGPIVFNVGSMRAALSEGKNIFRGVEPLVSVVEMEPRQAAPAPSAGVVAEELSSWLTAFAGSQRQLLDALRATWIPRAKDVSPGARTEVVRLVRRALKSPKLVAERDALLDELGAAAGTAPPARRETRRRLVRLELEEKRPAEK
jgi:hypothetical protein